MIRAFLEYNTFTHPLMVIVIQQQNSSFISLILLLIPNVIFYVCFLLSYFVCVVSVFLMSRYYILNHNINNAILSFERKRGAFKPC